MTDRKKPSWAFWMTVVLLSSPVLYVLSIGPWCWAFSRWGDVHRGTPASIYRPLVKIWFETDNQDRICIAIDWYANAFTKCHIGPGLGDRGYVILHYD
jgi:hypothetical protein